MIIDLRQLTPQSSEFRGTWDEDIFELPEGDGAKSAGSLDYDLRLFQEEGTLTVVGLLQAGFDLCCGCCLETFRHVVKLPGYLHSEEVAGRTTIDLTNAFREDILLALPVYPRCDQHGERTECPASTLLESQRDSEETQEEPPGIWDALEDVRPTSEADSDSS